MSLVRLSCLISAGLIAPLLAADEKLFTATPLTAEKSFTAGIEGPCCDREGNIYAVAPTKRSEIARTMPDGKTAIFVTLPGKSAGNGIVFDRKGIMFVADYTGLEVYCFGSGFTPVLDVTLTGFGGSTIHDF